MRVIALVMSSKYLGVVANDLLICVPHAREEGGRLLHAATEVCASVVKTYV